MAVLVAIAVLAVWAIANTDHVEVDWIADTTTAPLIVVIGALGFIIGFSSQLTVETLRPVPLSRERASYTLTITNGNLWLSQGPGDGPDADVIVYLSRGTGSEYVSGDLAQETLSFHDPHSGEVLATFSFDELDEAERALFRRVEGSVGDGVSRLVLHTTDLASWGLHDLDALLEAGGGSLTSTCSTIRSSSLWSPTGTRRSSP